MLQLRPDGGRRHRVVAVGLLAGEADALRDQAGSGHPLAPGLELLLEGRELAIAEPPQAAEMVEVVRSMISLS